ncbi:DUF4386 domain-containing protein [Marivita hallyeonensis]|uniref:DUF4386 domain-containing protein n=1 Tax=Marivita hallyeonensis TaxID=996342 RepID=UPI000932A99F|nr:DUF4386 domain-containing protein [Marivita hallyeonensis]
MTAASPHPVGTRSASKPAVRLAGLLYLVIILSGLSAEFVFRGPLLSSGDATTTIDAIAASMGMFRAGLVGDVVMLLADIALALVFFALLSDRAPILALSAMVFRLMQATVIAASLVLLAAVPGLVTKNQQDLVLAAVQAHAGGYDLGLILFGVNCFLMALIFLKVTALPRMISIGIAAAGVVYITGGLLRLTAPDWLVVFQPAYLICILAEVALCLWLLITGRL